MLSCYLYIKIEQLFVCLLSLTRENNKNKIFVTDILYSFVANLHRVRPYKISKRFHVIDLILLKQLFQIQLLFDSSLLPTNPCPGVNQET